MTIINARSLKQPDVAAAIANAQDGDIVVLPAGEEIWTQGVVVTKSIRIIGAGAEASILKRDSDTPNFRDAFFVLGTLSADKPISLSGVSFDNRILKPSYDTHAVGVQGTHGKDFGMTKVRVDHCSFYGGQRTLWVDGWVYGVCDHCQFTNGYQITVGVRGEGYPEMDRKERVQYGNLAAWYMEDCHFENDGRINDWMGATDVDYSGSMVWRRCTFDIQNSSGAAIWIAHGNQSYWNPDVENYFTGLIRMEIYQCKVNTQSCYRWSYFRGGRVLMWDNEFSTRDGSSPTVAGITEEEGFDSFSGQPPRTTWPGEDQINASFFWTNTCNGKACPPPQNWHDPQDQTFLVEGRDYWTKAPDNGTKTVYPKCGRPSRPDLPYQLGSAYWPVCTSFEPAPYPHPLVAEEPVPPEPTPEPPTGETYTGWYNELAEWLRAHPPTPDKSAGGRSKKKR